MKKKSPIKTGLLSGLVPVIFLIYAVLLKIAAGPFWLGANSDPAYLYLINSLYFFKGLSPSFVDHPGTTLQLLGAVVIKALHLTQGSPQIIDAVLRDPERYLHVLYYVLLAFNVATLLALGLYAAKKSKKPIFALLAQSGCLVFLLLRSYSSDLILPVAANVFAESLFPAIDNLFILCVCSLFFSSKTKASWGEAVLFAGVCALGIITKVSFAPLCIIPLLLLRGFRAKGIFLLALLAACFFLTIPIIPEYKEMFQYIYLFQANIGMHGTGGIGFMELSAWMRNAITFFTRQSYIFFVLISVLAGLLAILLLRKKVRWQAPQLKKGLVFLIIVWLGVVLQVLFVIKHPVSHYVAPAAGLLGLLWALLYYTLKSAFDLKDSYFAVLAAALILTFSWKAGFYQYHLKQANLEKYVFSQKVFEKYDDCIIAQHYRSSSIPYALYFGDDCKGRHRAFFPRLKELYPGAIVWNRWDYTFHNFPDQISEASLLHSGHCLVLYGGKMDFSFSYLDAELIDATGSEYVYKVLSSEREKVMQVFMLAKVFEIKKDYPSALIWAKRAKELGYPQLRVNRYIEELKAKIERDS